MNFPNLEVGAHICVPLNGAEASYAILLYRDPKSEQLGIILNCRNRLFNGVKILEPCGGTPNPEVDQGNAFVTAIRELIEEHSHKTNPQLRDVDLFNGDRPLLRFLGSCEVVSTGRPNGFPDANIALIFLEASEAYVKALDGFVANDEVDYVIIWPIGPLFSWPEDVSYTVGRFFFPAIDLFMASCPLL